MRGDVMRRLRASLESTKSSSCSIDDGVRLRSDARDDGCGSGRKVYVGSVSGERAVVVVEAIVVARVVDSGSGSGGDDGVVGGGSSGGVAS